MNNLCLKTNPRHYNYYFYQLPLSLLLPLLSLLLMLPLPLQQGDTRVFFNYHHSHPLLPWAPSCQYPLSIDLPNDPTCPSPAAASLLLSMFLTHHHPSAKRDSAASQGCSFSALVAVLIWDLDDHSMDKPYKPLEQSWIRRRQCFTRSYIPNAS